MLEYKLSAKLSCHFNFQIAYNGYGVMLQPVVMHKGDIKQTVQDFFKDRIRFMQTRHGQLNYDSTIAMVEEIQAYVYCFLCTAIHT